MALQSRFPPIKVKHPDYKGIHKLGATGWHNAPAGLTQPGVAVFERSAWLKPSRAQIREYHRKRKIVEANDGRMRFQEYEIAGQSERFTKADVEAMLAAFNENKRVRVVSTWNGEGTLAFSIGFERV